MYICKNSNIYFIMKHIYTKITIFFIISHFLIANIQSQFVENFSNFSFAQHNTWEGDTNKFTPVSTTAIPTNMRPALRLNDSTAGCSYISKPLQLSSSDTLEWQFWVKVSYIPTASNHARIYLAADHGNIRDSINNAYYISIGEIGKKIALCHYQNGTTDTLLVANQQLTSYTNSLRIQIIRYPIGRWEVAIDHSGTDTPLYDYHGSNIDSSSIHLNYFGILCTYTRSNATKFYIDDIAVLSQKMYHIIASCNDHGSVIPSDTVWVSSGTSQRFSIIPNPGYRIGSVSINNTPVDSIWESGEQSFLFPNITNNHTLDVNFCINQHLIITQTVGSGTMYPCDSVWVPHGNDQTFTFSPMNNNMLIAVSVDGNRVETTNGTYTLYSVSDNHTMEAIFSEIPDTNTHNITITWEGNGNISPSGSLFVNENDSILFCINPNPTSYIHSFVVNEIDETNNLVYNSSNENAAFLLTHITSDYTVHAIFKEKNYF